MTSNAVKIIEGIIAVYNFLMVILGTFGNIITVVICLRKRLRKTNTFIFFAFAAICDTIGLYEWNLRQFITYFFKVDWDLISLFYCRIDTLLQNVCFEASAWILVFFLFKFFWKFCSSNLFLKIRFSYV